MCLEIHDLLVTKAIAGREKDLDFLAEAARHGMADVSVLLERLAIVEVDPAIQRQARAVIARAFAGV